MLLSCRRADHRRFAFIELLPGKQEIERQYGFLSLFDAHRITRVFWYPVPGLYLGCKIAQFLFQLRDSCSSLRFPWPWRGWCLL